MAELEKKLKTLEISGLWSLPGEYQSIRILIPSYFIGACSLHGVDTSLIIPSSLLLLLATWRSDIQCVSGNIRKYVLHIITMSSPKP